MSYAVKCFDLQISLLIPECGVLPAEMAKVVDNFSSYYLVRDLPVYRFLEEDMLEIIKKGKGKDCTLLLFNVSRLFHSGSILNGSFFYYIFYFILFYRQFLCTLLQNPA